MKRESKANRQTVLASQLAHLRYRCSISPKTVRLPDVRDSKKCAVMPVSGAMPLILSLVMLPPDPPTRSQRPNLTNACRRVVLWVRWPIENVL